MVSVCLFFDEEEQQKRTPLKQPSPELDGYGYGAPFCAFEHNVCGLFRDGPADHHLDLKRTGSWTGGDRTGLD